MYARLVRLHVKEGQLDRAAAIFKERALVELQQQPGFVGALFLSQAPEPDGAIIIFWREREDSLRLERQGFYRAQIAKFESVFAAPPEPALYEVRVWAGAALPHGD